MKIAVISPNRQHLQDAAAALKAANHEVACHEGGKSHLRAVAEREQPDLMLADGMCCDPAELAQVEWVTSHFPDTAVVLMCSAHTPEFLLNSMRAGVREVLPSPAPAEAIVGAVARIAAKRAGAPLRPHGKVLAVMPCKGGSGATFIAANLARELSREANVLLIDLNLQFGDALALVHDGRPATTVAEVAGSTSRLDASLLASSAVRVSPTFSVLAAPQDPVQAMEIKPEQIESILSVAAAQYEFVVVDLPRAVDTLSIRVLDRAWRVFPVLQANLPAIHHAQRLLEVFRSLGYPADKTLPIVNRWERAGEIEFAQIQRALHGQEVLTLANSWRDVAASINHGEPLVEASRGNGVARQLIEIAQRLNPRPEEEQRSLLGRLFRKA
jgi:pilus assembly protein CpaE